VWFRDAGGHWNEQPKMEFCRSFARALLESNETYDVHDVASVICKALSKSKWACARQ
jgi:hypothetical protein